MPRLGDAGIGHGHGSSLASKNGRRAWSHGAGGFPTYARAKVPAERHLQSGLGQFLAKQHQRRPPLAAPTLPAIGLCMVKDGMSHISLAESFPLNSTEVACA